MKIRAALALYVGLVVYCALSGFFGAGGLAATQNLERQADDMRRNLAALAEREEELSARLGSVRDDAQTLAIEARELGYVAADEGIIRVKPEVPRPVAPEAGRVLAATEPPSLDDGSIQHLSLLAMLIVFPGTYALRLFRRPGGVRVRKPSTPLRNGLA